MPDITKSFGTVLVTDKVWGEILALLGENGSGKTTLLNMLLVIYFPGEGQICIDGKPVTIASPKDAWHRHDSSALQTGGRADGG